MRETTEIVSRNSPFIHVRGPEVHATELAAGVEHRGGQVIRLDGAKMKVAEELFREYFRSFRFPEYFGWNWAAFHECMTSLENFPALTYLTIIVNAEKLLEDEPIDRAIYLDQLNSIGSRWANSFGLGLEWGKGEVAFNTLFICPPEFRNRFLVSELR